MNVAFPDARKLPFAPITPDGAEELTSNRPPWANVRLPAKSNRTLFAASPGPAEMGMALAIVFRPRRIDSVSV